MIQPFHILSGFVAFFKQKSLQSHIENCRFWLRCQKELGNWRVAHSLEALTAFKVFLACQFTSTDVYYIELASIKQISKLM
jgi:hypothetical protein